MGFFHDADVTDDVTPVASLGADIRALRKSRKMTLSALAQTLGRSVGWLSQVERDLSEPTISALGAIAKALDVSVSSFLQVGAAPQDDGIVVRASARRPIGNRTAGLTEELLSPDLTDDFEVIHSSFAPDAALAEPVTRQTQEVGYIVSGKFDLTVDGKAYALSAGDSFRLRGEPFTWRNPGPDTCEIIWVISPPVY